MAKLEISIKNLKVVQDAIKAKMYKDIFPKVLYDAQQLAVPKLKELFIEKLEETMAIQGLRGDFAGIVQQDAQAHLGLTDAFAADSIEQIKDIIRENVFQATDISQTSNGVIGFKFSPKQISEEVLQIPNASYTSSKGDEIPWLQWLLKGGMVSAEITFQISSRASTRTVSRSSRALMIAFGDEEIGWDIDDYSRFSEKGNFIADVTTDPEWEDKSKAIIIGAIKKGFASV